MVTSGSGPSQPFRAGNMRTVRLCLLGGFRAEVGGNLVPESAWRGRNSRDLVKLLCLHEHRGLHKDRIQDLLWPHLDEGAAGLALRKAMHFARRALDQDEKGTILAAKGGVISLDEARVWTDVDEFEARARTALEAADVDLIVEALATWTGEALPENAYEDWAEPKRAELARLHLRLLYEGARLAEAASRVELAVQFLMTLTSEEPAAEDAHRSLMRLHALAGRRSEALAQFETCRQSLAREVDSQPMPETLDLWERIRAGKFPPVGFDSSAEVTLPRPTLPDAIHRSPPAGFSGRIRPMQILLERWRSVFSSRQPRLVIVRGEAGVGKTRLIAEAARQVHDSGGGVLWGSCYHHQAELAYGPFVEAFEAYFHGLPQPFVQRLADAYVELAPMLPSLGRLGPHPAAVNIDRSRLFDAVARLLTAMAGDHSGTDTRALFLAVDDLQHADAASLSLLHYLARLDGPRPWLLVASLRDAPSSVSGGLDSLLSSLVRAGECQDIDLLRLSEADCRGLVESRLTGTVDQALSDEIYGLSLGNPLFAGQILDSLLEHGHVAQMNGAWRLKAEPSPRSQDERPGPPARDIPSQIDSLVGEKVATLDKMARLALDLGAVLGPRFNLSLLTAAMRCVLTRPVFELEVVEAVEASMKVGLTEDRDGGYAFRHPLLSSAVETRLSASKRALLHRAIASALESSNPDQSEALAYHFTAGGQTEKAIGHLERAADQALQSFANEIAIARYREVLRLLGPEQAWDRARVEVKLGHLLVRLGQDVQALELLDRAVAVLREGPDEEALWLALAELGRVRGRLGELEEGMHAMRTAVARLPKHACTQGSMLLRLAHASLLFSSGQYVQAEEIAVTVGAIARESGAEGVLIEAELQRSSTAVMLTGVEAAGEIVRAILPLVEAHGGLETLLHALHALGFGHMMTGHFRQMSDAAKKALDTARRMGDRSQIAIQTARMGQAALLGGDVCRARELIDAAWTQAEDLQTGSVRMYVQMYRGQLRNLMGRWTEAREALETVFESAMAAQNMQAARTAAFWLAEPDVVEGRLAEALCRLEKVEPKSPIHRDQPLDLDRLLMAVQTEGVRAELSARSQEEVDPSAEIVAELAVERFRKAGAFLYLGAALRYRGLIRLRLGRTEAGLQSMHEGLRLSRRIEYRWGEVSDLCNMAHGYHLLGRRRESDSALQECIHRTEELGVPELGERFLAASRG